MSNLKKILLVMIIFAGIGCEVEASSLTIDQIRNQNKAYLKQQGITFLDGEIKIAKANFLISQSTDNYYVSQIQKYLSMHREQEKNGFVEEPTPRVKELLHFKQSAKYQYKKYSNELSASSTHLRHTIPELKMAYHFVGVPDSEIDKSIGIAPYGAYKQIKYGDENDGWDGAIQFFEKKGIGVCEFKEHNLKLAHGGIELVKELVTNDVFGKPTVILIQGTKDTGFLYQVSWYDDTFSRELACAAETFSYALKNNVLELARAIERAQ